MQRISEKWLHFLERTRYALSIISFRYVKSKWCLTFAKHHLLCLYARHGIHLGGGSPLWGRLSQPPTTSQSQGCLPWGRIWRKAEANLRSEEHESHQAGHGGWVCETTQSPIELRKKKITMACKCGRYMEGKRYDLILGGLTEGNLVTTNWTKN